MRGLSGFVAALVVMGVVSEAFCISLTVNSGVRYQTFTGWEATAQAGQTDSPYFNQYKEQLWNSVVDLGITRLRLEVPSSIEGSGSGYTVVNDNTDPHSINWAGYNFTSLDNKIDNVVIPMRQHLQAAGQSLQLNACYVSFIKQADPTYAHQDPQEYAEFVEATYLHMQSKYGFAPTTWEMSLEPDNTYWWNGTHIGQAIVAVGDRLKADGFTPRIIAPSVSWAERTTTYTNDMMAVPGASQYVTEIATHGYDLWNDTNRRALAALGNTYGKNTSMLERIGIDHYSLMKDLKLANVSAWQQYCLCYPTTDNGAQYFTIDTSDPNNPKVVIGKETKLLREFMHFIKPGAVRVDASSDSGNYDPVAFINADGGYVMVMNSPSTLQFSIRGLPAGTYGLEYTTLAGVTTDFANMTITDGQALTHGGTGDGVLVVYQIVPEPLSLSLLTAGCVALLLRRGKA